MAKTNYEESKNKLSALLRDKPATTPLQEVRPVVEPAQPAAKSKPKSGKEAGEVHVNFWADAALVKQLKRYGVDHDLTIKEVCIKALESFLNGKA